MELQGVVEKLLCNICEAAGGSGHSSSPEHASQKLITCAVVISKRSSSASRAQRSTCFST